MAVLRVKSTNPDFSWIAHKAPATQRTAQAPFSREIRKGTAYGWFTDVSTDSPLEYVVWFKDHPHMISFANQRTDFEYLDTTRYGHPYGAIAMIGAHFSTAEKELYEKDTPAHAEVSYFMEGRRGVLASLAKILTSEAAGRKVEIKPLPGTLGNCDFAQEVVCTAPTVHEALNLMVSVSIIMTLKDEDFYLPMKWADKVRYLKGFEKLSAPYYMCRLFKVLGAGDPGSFDKLKAEGYFGSTRGIDLKFGTSQFQRHGMIREVLKGGLSLYDLGCGEGFHFTRLSPKYEEIHAIDRDLSRTPKALEGSSAVFFPEETELSPEWAKEEAELEGSDILMTEVLEHMEQPVASAFLTEVLNKNPKQVVITLPNGEFNKHFPLNEDAQFRHYDHKWEPSLMQAAEFVNSSLPPNVGWKVSLSGGGDVVDGVALFTFIHITK